MSSAYRRKVNWRRELAAIFVICTICFLFFWRMSFTDLILPRGDAFTYFYPYWAYRNFVMSHGSLPVWNPYLFMGAPFLANSQTGVLYPLNWPLIWLDAPTAVKAAIVFHIMLAAAGTYIFARDTLKYSLSASTLASIVFALGGYLTAQVEHVNQLQGLAWLPWIFWLWQTAVRTGFARHIVWLGIVLALQILAGHTQSAFICVTGVILIAVSRFVQGALPGIRKAGLRQNIFKLLRPVRVYFLPLVIALLIAAGLAAAQLLPTAELASLSSRSGGLPIIEAISFSLRPTLVGKSLLPGYSTPSLFSEYVAYSGIVALVLALVGGWKDRRNSRTTGLIVLACSGLFLALGAYNPIYWILVKVIPVFRLFRAPARWLILFAFGSACLSGAGIEELRRQTASKIRIQQLWPFLIILNLIAWSMLAGLESSEVAGAAAPSVGEIALWSTAGLVSMSLYVITCFVLQRSRRVVVNLFIVASIVELFYASRALPLNALTTPTAWTGQRPSISTLLAAEWDQTPPDRFLSMSDILFDPGDLREMRAVYGPYLDESQMYDLVVAIKQKEIIAPNLPLYWRIPAVDGFDGGILPTRDYSRFSQIAIGNAAPSPDGRLRENLKTVPSLEWLSLTNTRWIITDKVYDVWLDSVYYDLQFSERSEPSPGFPRMPISGWLDEPFVATEVGIVGHVESESPSAPNTPVGSLAVFSDRESIEPTLTIPLVADPAQRGALKQVGGSISKVAGNFDPQNIDSVEFQNWASWDKPLVVDHVQFWPDSDFEGAVVLRGMTSVDSRDGSFVSLTLSPNHDLRLANSGDVKLYEFTHTVPRAYITCQVEVVADQEAMWEAVGKMQGNVNAVIMDTSPQSSTCTEPTGNATITEYAPERVVLHSTSSAASSYLVLSDSYYPGWQATIDGQPTPILRANGMFRAIHLFAGDHTIGFTFQSRALELGALISAAFIVASAVLIVIAPKLRYTGMN